MELSNKRNTLIDKIVNFMEGKVDGVATLKEIYIDVKNQFMDTKEQIPNHIEEKVRCVIYRDNRLKRVAKGIYMLTGSKTAGLIIHGDGRKLEEIEDSSIDLIITDHPWSDKKAHKSGNQKNFSAEYENVCFNYTQEDFNQKARVMKKGAYLVECLPTESYSNYEYLYKIKEMAKKAGFEYYAKLMWIKQPEGSINTGRTTKGTEDIMIFTKGKARRLSPDKKPYMTKTQLLGRLDIPAPKPKEKRHQAEKPVRLYEYLIEAMSNEEDVLLDQFGGSCNLIEAALNKNRFAIVYEYLKKFVIKAVNRLGAIPLYVHDDNIKKIENTVETETLPLEEVLGHQPEANVVVVDSIEENESESKDTTITKNTNKEEQSNNQVTTNAQSEIIPRNVVDFQQKLLLDLSKHKPSFFAKTDIDFIKTINKESMEQTHCLNELFQKIYDTAYEKHYRRLYTNFDLFQEQIFNEIKVYLQDIFNKKIANKYIRNFYKDYLIETEDFIKYKIKKCGATTFADITENLSYNIDNYLNLVAKHKSFKNKDSSSVKTKILKLLI